VSLLRVPGPGVEDLEHRLHEEGRAGEQQRERPRARQRRGPAGHCQGPLGPCTDAPDNPFLASRLQPDCLSGPGHPMVFQANGQDYLVFHAWATRRGCRPAGNARFMHVARLNWEGDSPRIGPPPGAPQR